MFFLSASSVKEIESSVDKLSEDVSALTKFLNNMAEHLINFGISLIIAVIIFIIGKLVIKIIRKFIKNLLTKSGVDVGVIKFSDSIINAVGYIIVIIIICAQIGIQTTSLITLLGTGSLSVGLALQGSLSNFAGGILILVSKPFVIGDYVMIDGEEGTVKKIDIIYTTLVKYDNRIIKCPNGEVASKTITNYTNVDGRRVDVKFSVHYDSDIIRVKEIVKNIIINCPYILSDRPNDVVVMELDESAVNLETRAWVSPQNYWDAYFYLIENIKLELDANGIVIPYNQLVVHLENEE